MISKMVNEAFNIQECYFVYKSFHKMKGKKLFHVNFQNTERMKEKVCDRTKIFCLGNPIAATTYVSHIINSFLELFTRLYNVKCCFVCKLLPLISVAERVH